MSSVLAVADPGPNFKGGWQAPGGGLVGMEYHKSHKQNQSREEGELRNFTSLMKKHTKAGLINRFG